MRKRMKRAFTLMEVVIVIAIIAILVGGLSFYGSVSVNNSRIETAESFLKVLATDMEAAFDDYGPYETNSALDSSQQKTKDKQKFPFHVSLWTFLAPWWWS